MVASHLSGSRDSPWTCYSESGTVTFLFTDIEGSTRLWESEPVRMAEALARHDRLCREAVEAHGGVLVKMIGDGLHAVFGDPGAAVAATLALQRGMAAIAEDCGLPFRMRCGLHAGAAQERDGDYFGSAVNRAARIMGAAHGGQVLLSQAVADRGAGALPGRDGPAAPRPRAPARPRGSRGRLAAAASRSAGRRSRRCARSTRRPTTCRSS